MSRSLVGSLDLGIMSKVGETYPEYKRRQITVGNYVMAGMARAVSEQTGETITILWDVDDQFNVGESAEGYEFKYDSRFRSTGNLYIEIREKGLDGIWRDSGIYRGDNTQFYVIGDLETMWVFHIDDIRSIVEKVGPQEGYALRQVRTGANSAIGALLPIREQIWAFTGEEWVSVDEQDDVAHLDTESGLWAGGALFSVEQYSQLRSDFENSAIDFISDLRTWYTNGRTGDMPVPQDYGIDPEVEKL